MAGRQQKAGCSSAGPAQGWEHATRWLALLLVAPRKDVAVQLASPCRVLAPHGQGCLFLLAARVAYLAGGTGRGLLTAALQLALLDPGAASSTTDVSPAASWLRASCQAHGEQAAGCGASPQQQQQQDGRKQGPAPGGPDQDQNRDVDGGPATVTGTGVAGRKGGQGSGGGGGGGSAPAADVRALIHARRVVADLLLRPPGDDTRGAACR